jgi:hypothetical protein
MCRLSFSMIELPMASIISRIRCLVEVILAGCRPPERYAIPELSNATHPETRRFTKRGARKYSVPDGFETVLRQVPHSEAVHLAETSPTRALAGNGVRVILTAPY